MSALIAAALSLSSVFATATSNVFSGGFDPIIGLPPDVTPVELWPSRLTKPQNITSVTNMTIGIGSQGNWTGDNQTYRITIKKVLSKAWGMLPDTTPFDADEKVSTLTTPTNPGEVQYAFSRNVSPNSTYSVLPPVVRGQNINFVFTNLSGSAVWLHCERTTYPYSTQAWDLVIPIP